MTPMLLDFFPLVSRKMLGSLMEFGVLFSSMYGCGRKLLGCFSVLFGLESLVLGFYLFSFGGPYLGCLYIVVGPHFL